MFLPSSHKSTSWPYTELLRGVTDNSSAFIFPCMKIVGNSDKISCFNRPVHFEKNSWFIRLACCHGIEI